MTERRLEQTLGEKRVRASFNPSLDSLVDEIKMKTAELIDLCEKNKSADAYSAQETKRLWTLAQTEFENAAMWAVKAATSEK